MAEQFSLPQEQVLEELNGEGSGWVLPWGPLIPSSTPLRRWGSGPARPRGTHSTAEHPERPRGGGGGAPCRLPCALQVSAAASGRRCTPSSRAPCMRRWPRCSAWARVSVSGGPAPHSSCHLSGALPCLSGLSVHTWLPVPWGRFPYNHGDRGPPGPLGCSDFPQGL